jgi:exodeoxyribonuclease VII large subunit
MEQVAFVWGPPRQTYTVSEFTTHLAGILQEEFGDVWIAGEISGCKLSGAGHWYFTLKDEEAQLRSVCFRNTARYLRFKPQDGIHVLVRGRIDVYAPRGEYQLIADVIEPQGHGALQFAFEQLKRKLAAEGLFDAGRKRPLPKYPARIGIVSSPAGAVIQDMLNVLGRRFPGLHIRLYPALVQGEGSVSQVVRGIEYFSDSGWAEVVIVARGGGSLEDLWTFNEEAVARAIAECAVPVVNAVGHETDITIADFVADLRAPTPSAAAELVICTREQVLESISNCARKLEKGVRYRLAMSARRLHQLGIERSTAALHRRIGRSAQRVDDLDYRLRERIRSLLDARNRRLSALELRVRRQDVRLRFAEARRRLERSGKSLEDCMRSRLTRAHRRFEPLLAHLTQLSPLRILERGYAIVQNETGAVVKHPADAPAGTEIKVRIAKGQLQAHVIASGESRD